MLRANGVFAAFWNMDDGRIEWVAGLQQVVRANAPVPSAGSDNKVPSHPLFTDFERSEFAHTHRRTAESLTATIGTHSLTVVIPAEQRAELLDRIRTYLRSRPETAEGEFDFPLRTDVIRTTRRTVDMPPPQQD